MVVLIAILTPSLMAAHETARRIRCAAHVQQIGYGIHMYADDNRGRLPRIEYRGPTPSLRPPAGPPAPSWSTDTMLVRYESLAPGHRPAPGGMHATWDGLGVLFDEEYIGHPAALYCPSHHGKHDYSVYQSAWFQPSGPIVSNYQYRVPPTSPFLADLNSWTTIMADGMATKSDYNHRIGNNFLRTDASVAWYSDEDGSLFSTLPDDPSVVTQPSSGGDKWKHLDQPFAH